MDDIRTICETDVANMCVHIGEPRILANAMRTMNLNSFINDFTSHSGRVYLGHCNVCLCCFESIIICLHSCKITQQTRFREFHSALCNHLPKCCLVCKKLAERNTIMASMDNCFERLLRSADCAHAMMDPTRTETTLCNFKSATFSEKHVSDWDPHVVKENLSMVVNMPKEGERSQNRYTFGVAGNQNHGMSVMKCITDTNGASQENEDFAFWPACAADIPFVPIDYILITIATDCRADICRIAASNAWLCHCICTADGSLQQRFKPLFLLLFCAIFLQYFHVARIRCCAIHGDVAQWESTKYLANRRILQNAEIAYLRQEEVVKASSLGLLS
mmetsp:Transcript_20630/g.33271  ORF Transcript_20630/g.33271 Transcript_20630/m.33271 type:complete len:333 (+) Transcript_20630:333-1331(+)